MRTLPSPNRRHVVAGLAGLGLALPALAQDTGLVPDSETDQSRALQQALEAALSTGYLRLPPGRFRASGIRFPGNLVLEGVPGATWLVGAGSAIGSVMAQKNLVFRDIGFAGDSGSDPLIGVDASQSISFERCLFRDSPGVGLGLRVSSVTVRDCDFAGHGDAAIHTLDGNGTLITGNTILRCGNAGIRVWRSAKGADGTIVTQNRISDIAWRDGGNGQNGNGINVYLADEVLVADNHLSDCAFSAIRLNTTRDTIVTGNQCLKSGEVAIFSEFAFSGSIIAQNLIDGAAAGISMTNMDQGGQMAVCSGNIVRNIADKSTVNPDASPIGIFAEADAAITGNVIDGVPGTAIAAGWGPYLRNVVISDNVVTNSRIGVAISVAEGAGAVTLGTNRLDTSEHQVTGMLWDQLAEPDLLSAIAKYPQIMVR